MADAEIIDEKRIPSFAESKSEDEGVGQVVDWTEEEEKKLVRKYGYSAPEHIRGRGRGLKNHKDAWIRT